MNTVCHKFIPQATTVKGIEWGDFLTLRPTLQTSADIARDRLALPSEFSTRDEEQQTARLSPS